MYNHWESSASIDTVVAELSSYSSPHIGNILAYSSSN